MDNPCKVRLLPGLYIAICVWVILFAQKNDPNLLLTTSTMSKASSISVKAAGVVESKGGENDPTEQGNTSTTTIVEDVLVELLMNKENKPVVVEQGILLHQDLLEEEERTGGNNNNNETQPTTTSPAPKEEVSSTSQHKGSVCIHGRWFGRTFNRIMTHARAVEYAKQENQGDHYDHVRLEPSQMKVYQEWFDFQVVAGGNDTETPPVVEMLTPGNGQQDDPCTVSKSARDWFYQKGDGNCTYNLGLDLLRPYLNQAHHEEASRIMLKVYQNQFALLLLQGAAFPIQSTSSV